MKLNGLTYKKTPGYWRMSVILFFVLCFESIAVFAQSEKTILHYFFVTGCSSCKETGEVLDVVRNRQDIKIEIHEYNTIEQQNQNLLEQYFEIYKVGENEQKVPVIFVGNRYFAGKDQIKRELLQYLESSNVPATATVRQIENQNLIKSRFSSFKALGALLVGVVNGMTPCSLSMLLLFISLLLVKNVNILKMGIAYCLGKFVTYFLLGTVFYGIMQQLNNNVFARIIKYLIIGLIIIFACLNLLDYFYAKREKYDRIKLQLPKALRHWNHKWIKKIGKWENPELLLSFSLSLGVMTSVGEFLCTGQIYLTTILYMVHNQARQVLNIQAIMYFLLYNSGFIIPLMVITAVIYKGRQLFDVSELIRNKMHLIKLVNSVIFLVIGILIFVYY